MYAKGAASKSTLPPDRTFLDFRLMHDVSEQDRVRQSSDFEAQHLRKGRSGS